MPMTTTINWQCCCLRSLPATAFKPCCLPLRASLHFPPSEIETKFGANSSLQTTIKSSCNCCCNWPFARRSLTVRKSISAIPRHCKALYNYYWHQVAVRTSRTAVQLLLAPARSALGAKVLYIFYWHQLAVRTSRRPSTITTGTSLQCGRREAAVQQLLAPACSALGAKLLYFFYWGGPFFPQTN